MTDEMNPYLGLICLIVLSAVFSETGLQCAAVTVIPNVQVTLINDSTYFNCSTTSEKVEWFFISDENPHHSVIYSYGTVKPHYQERFRVEKYVKIIEKQFNLVLKSVARNDSGLYICRDPDSLNEKGETQLIVLAIKVIPKVAVALINDSTYFNCSTTSEKVEWLFRSDEDLHQSFIYSYGTAVKPPYQERFRVEKYVKIIEKQFNLVLKSVAMDDAGRYICLDPGSLNEKGEAELIVLETEPFCESNLNVDGPIIIGPNSCAIKPETVQLSCSVKYSGVQFPELQWIKTDENIAINSSKCSDSGNVYTCNLTIEPELQMDGSSYACQTTQSMTRQYNCTSDVFRILYVLGEHTERIGSINDKVNCSVNSSSQSCTYSWNFDNGTINGTESHDSVIELKRPGRFICEANCTIRNMNCTFTAMTVNVTDNAVLQSDGNIPIIIIGIIVLIVAVVAPAFGINIILRKKRKQSTGRRETPDEEWMALNVQNSRGVFGEDNILRIITPMADKNHNRRVRGLTILDSELFVAFEMSNIIEVFPINFPLSSHILVVNGLMYPGTIAACATNSCLYVLDQIINSRKKIFRIRPDGTEINNWETDDDDKGRISVNRDGNVVMTAYDKGKVKIYSPDGTLLRDKTIDLSGTNITYIFHAINVADGNFIIGHGIFKSNLHQVCKIDATGKVLLSYGNDKGSGDAQLNCPAYVAERKDGSILVADHENHRIIRLNSELELEEILFTKKNCNVSQPNVMFVYEKTEPALLFLGCNKTLKSGGYVLVLRLSQ